MESHTSVRSLDLGGHLRLVEDAACKRARHVGTLVVVYADVGVVNRDKFLLAFVGVDGPGITAVADRNAGNGFGNMLRESRADNSKDEGREKNRQNDRSQRSLG
jgi:hypothetical protein